MFKSGKKLICLLAVVCICLLAALIPGCNGESEPYTASPDFDAVLEYTSYDLPEKYDGFITICNSAGALNRACLRAGYSLFSGNEDNNAEKAVEEYLAGHADKSLIVCVFGKTGYMGQYRIKEIGIENGKLTMYIHCPDAEPDISGGGIPVSEVMNSVYLIAGIDKTAAAHVSELTYAFV